MTFSSVAQSSVPAFIQPDTGQVAALSADDCNNHSLKNLAVSQCSLNEASGTQDTKKDSQAGDEITIICLFHALDLELSVCIESTTQKQIPIMTRRLVALQPFSIKKPPRMAS